MLNVSKPQISRNEIMASKNNGSQYVSYKKLKEAMMLHLRSDGKYLYIYKTGYFWEKLTKNVSLRLRQEIFAVEAQAELEKSMLDRAVIDLTEDIRILIENKNLNSERYIHFKNGIYDLFSKRLIKEPTEDTKNLIFSYVVDACFIEPKMALNRMSTFMYFMRTSFKSDEIMKEYVCQNIGYSVSSVNSLRKAVIFIGSTATGKSTFARFLAAVIQPQSQVSYVNFQDLGDKFRLYDAACAKLNIGDEMSRGRARILANFKSMTAGDTVVIERKGKDPIEIKPNVRQIYCTNYLPTFDDGNAMAIFDRLNIVPFYKTVEETKRDYNLLEKLLKEKNAILSLAVDKFADVLKNNGCFTVPAEVEECKGRYIMQENSVNEFIDNCLVEDETVKGISSVEVFDEYMLFCNRNGLKIQNRTDLREGIVNHFPLVSHKRIRLSNTENVQAYSCLSLKKDESNDEKQ